MIMKVNIKYISAICVFCGLTSCMNLDPKAEIGDSLVWEKADNFQLFANQFYGWTRDLQSGNTYQYGFSDGPHSDFRSDIVCSTIVNAYNQGTNSIEATDANYNSLYKRIYYTNLLIKHAGNFSNQAAIATPLGEALWFRAYLYFELVQLYGDAILLTEPVDMDSERLYQSQDDRGVVIDQCLKDLQRAAELLPDKAEEGRVTSGAANALLSRVALYEGTWQKFHNQNTSRATELLTIAKNAAKAVIDAGNYELFYNAELGNDSYRYMFILEDAAQCNPAGIAKSANKEYIMTTRHRDGDKLALNVTHAVTTSNVIWITRKMANMYLCDDGLPISKSPRFAGYNGATTEFQNRDNRMRCNMLANGDKFWDNDSKWRTTWTDADLSNCRTARVTSGSGYLCKKWAVERKVDDYYESMDYPVIRYAEVLLNYAEAAYEINDNISDQDLDISLNLVRQRVNKNMPKLSNSFVTSNGLSMREEIRRERTVELFMEGFRLDDLKRWATAVDEMSKDLTGVKITGTWFETNWPNHGRQLDSEGCLILYTDRQWSKKNYLLPLPSDQLQLNPQLNQNPGWSNK